MATSSDADLNKITMMCTTCGVSMVGIVPYQAHINGKQHKRAEELQKNRALFTTTTTTTYAVHGDNSFYCSICRKSMTGPEPYRQHMDSAKHLKAAGQSLRSPKPSITTVTVTEETISRMDCTDTDAREDKPDDYYQNMHMKHVKIVEQNESIADALSKMGYID